MFPVVSAELRGHGRSVARAILTRVEAGELTASDAAKEFTDAGLPPANVPELARALQIYASSGRVSFAKALAGCEAYTLARLEAQGGSGMQASRWVGSGTTDFSLPSSGLGLRASGLSNLSPQKDPVYNSAGDVITWSGVQVGASVDDRVAERLGSGVGAYTNLRQSPLKRALHSHSNSNAY